MSGQTIFEIPTSVSSHFLDETKAESLASQPRLGEAFRDVITSEEAEILVRRAVAPDAELLQYHLRPYSEEKIGFLGTHLCLVATTQRPGLGLEKRSFFVKTVPYDVPTQAAYIEEKGCFKKEAVFVRDLVPLLVERYKGEAWTPKCYFIKKNTLVFEDMKFKGFSNRSRFFDLRTMKSAVACIARFHACSLLAEQKLNGKTLNMLFPELLEETEFRRTGRSNDWYNNAINFAVWQASELGLDTSRMREAAELTFDMVQPSKTKRNVVSHGDLWSSNLLFDCSDRCNIIDFQLIRYSPLAHDLVQLLYLCGTRELREKHESELVRHYYKTLTENLKLSGFEAIAPPYEELLMGVEEQKLPSLVTAIIFHPTVLMDGKVAAEIMDNPKTYQAYYFEDRRPFVARIMAEDSAYEKIIKDELREFSEMSMKIDELPRPT